MNIPGSTSETTRNDAKQLLEQGEMRAARELIEKELRADRNCAELLAMLADVEFADGNVMPGQDRLTEAAKASGWNAEFTARRIRVLGRNALWHDGLRAVESIPEDESIPEEVRHDSQVRAEAGRFYRRCGCPAHAACCYGLREGPSALVRVARLWCWLLSDGPCARTRRKANKPGENKAKWEENKAKWEENKAYKREEEKLLSWLRQPIGYTDQLYRIPGLQERDARRVQTELGRLQYPRWHLWVRWMAVGRWLYYLQFAAVIVAWPVLIVISRQAGFASGPAGAWVWPLLSAFIATEPVALLAVLLFRPDWEPRNSNLMQSIGAIFACFVVTGLAVAAVIGAYDQHALPTAGVWSWVVLGALAVPLTLFCYFAVSLFFNLAWLWQLRRLIRKDCPLAVLDALLFIFDGLRDPLECRHLGQRLNLAAALEYAARRITRDLVPKFYRRYLASGDWLTEQAAQWAEALRQMQREMVASGPDIPAQTEAALADEIRCLATGDLGALATCALPPPPPRPSRRDRAVSAFRTVLEALLPLVLVLAAQPIVHGILHRTPGLWYWFLIATIAWALLIVLLWLDPDLRDKIETVSQMTGLAGKRPGTGP